ncbi:MAG: hypothetical protein R2744_12060 [Bacteroidales bacterium]
MVASLDSRETRTEVSTLKGLFDGRSRYRWRGIVTVTKGEARGITGGNLSLLSTLSRTGIADWLAGKILFIEDTGEHLYRLDRMMTGLKLAGIPGSCGNNLWRTYR